MNPEDLAQLQNFLSSAQSIFILTGKNAGQDSLAASLSLFLSLSKLGKSVSVACPRVPTVEFADLIGIDKLKKEVGNKNLIISFPYVEGAIEKVSYNIEDGKFNLVIQPRTGVEPLSTQQVNYSYSGAKADLLFTIGTPNLGDLENLFSESDLSPETPMVNIDHHPENSYYGKINLVDPSSSSTSEMVTFLLKGLGLKLDPDTATNLLIGIISATDNFSSSLTSPFAFEAAALCLKAGGKRQRTLLPKEEKAQMRPMSQEVSAKKSPPSEMPADWLAPKIYKGSTKI